MSAWTSAVMRGTRPGGMLDAFTRPARKKAVCAICGLVLATCAAAWALLLRWRAVLPLLAAGTCALIYRRMAYCAFGGVTGDLAGWLTQSAGLHRDRRETMKLYIGGAYQGQEELARRENPGAVIVADFHEVVREGLRRGENGVQAAERILREQPDAVIVANEIGAGIVPMEAEDRAWREAVGRALCILAQEAKQVTQVVCGIGVSIK